MRRRILLRDLMYLHYDPKPASVNGRLRRLLSAQKNCSGVIWLQTKRSNANLESQVRRSARLNRPGPPHAATCYNGP